MNSPIGKKEILETIEAAFTELESQKFALDQSAIVAITNIRGDIIYVNEEFCRISKYKEEELLGKNHRIINSNYHPKEFFNDMWQTISRGNVWRGEIRNKAKDGEFYWVSTTITPFKHSDGKLASFVSIRFDITRQKRLEMELANKVEELDSTLRKLVLQNRQLEDFCHIVSHNLRAPLSNLTLLSELIKDCKDPDELVEMNEKLNETSHHLQETFEELVTSLQVKNDIHLKKEEVSLEESFKKTLKSMDTQLKLIKGKISVDFSACPNVNYPKKYLDSLFNNLISNSIKYASDERPLRIKIKSYIKNGWKFLEFKDNGLGLDLDRYGDRLFKLRKTFHVHPQAKGFGLFITKSQIEAMGGNIEVESIPDSYFKVKVQIQEIET